MKLKKKTLFFLPGPWISAESAHAEKRLRGRQAANKFSLSHSRSQVRFSPSEHRGQPMKPWKQMNILDLQQHGVGPELPAFALLQLLIPLLKVVMPAHAGSSFLSTKSEKNQIKWQGWTLVKMVDYDANTLCSGGTAAIILQEPHL